jgi:hypothetical protein
LDFVSLDGIYATKVGNTITIGDAKQEYNNTTMFNMYTGTAQNTMQNMFTLLPKTNLYYHKNNGIPKTALANLEIYINDTDTKWKTNQSMKIVLSDQINFGNLGIVVYTDATNQFGQSGNYGITVGVVANPSPNAIIEIVCVDETNYEFIIISH